MHLIDANELLKAMDTWDKFGYTARYGLERLDKDDKDFVPYVKYDDMVNAVKNAPTMDAVPVIHAKWIFEEADTDGIGNNQYKCSHCGHGDIHADDVVVNYCWFCGALMDGGKENERDCRKGR